MSSMSAAREHALPAGDLRKAYDQRKNDVEHETSIRSCDFSSFPSGNDDSAKDEFGNDGLGQETERNQLQERKSEDQSMLEESRKRESEDQSMLEKSRRLRLLKSVAASFYPRMSRGVSFFPDSSPDDEDVGLETVSIPPDTYTFFALGYIFSLPYILSIVVFSVQMGIYMLTLWTLIEGSSPHNPYKVPVYVSPKVQGAQVLAILITAASLVPDTINTAVITCVKLRQLTLPMRFRDRGLRSHIYSTNRVKMWLTVLIRFLESTTVATVTFFLIFQSIEVIELFFNFAALSFVSSLDDLAFAVARDGFLGYNSSITEMALTVEASEVRISREKIGRKFMFGRIYVFTMLTAMLTLWGVIHLKQEEAGYDCQSCSIQLDDGFQDACSLLSGVYELKERESNGYPLYVNHEADAILRYNDDEQEWMFEGHHCILYSSETEEYDITNVPDSVIWNVFAPYSQFHGGILQHFYLACNDCDRHEDYHGDEEYFFKNVCSGAGKCVNKKCVCDDGGDGPQCELFSPAQWCEILVQDTYSNFDEDEYTLDKTGTGKYIMMKASDQSAAEYLKVYGRPVYFGYTKDTLGKFIMFTGRRYILGNSSKVFGTRDYNDFVDLLLNRKSTAELIYGPGDNSSHRANIYETHGYAKDRVKGLELISEPADVGTNTYQDPVDEMLWYSLIESDYFIGLRQENVVPKEGFMLNCVPHCNFSNFHKNGEWTYGDDDWVVNSCGGENSEMGEAAERVYLWLTNKYGIWDDDVAWDKNSTVNGNNG